MARSPVGMTGGTGGMLSGGMGGLPGSGGVQASGGVGGMMSTGGAAGIAGMVASGGAGGMTGGSGGIGGMTGGTGGSGGLPATGGSGGGGSGGSTAPTGDVCERWTQLHANASESPWDGDVATCDPGDMTAESRETALGLVNLYRDMAGLMPVAMSDENNRLAQGCALLMAANGTITHTPPASWDCYTEESADTAGASSLSSGPAVGSVDGYMIDPGNPTTIGHRRWILSNMLAGIGFGSAGRFSCQYQPAQRPPAGAKAWAAWPSPGEFPNDAFGTRFATLAQTGWTVQSDTIDLGDADVTVTSDGAELDVTVTQLSPGYGSRYALRFNPSGWTATAGKTYHVALSGTSMPIEYDVQVVDCP